MPSRNLDLHGNVPDKCSVVLLLIDVINPMAFPGSGKLVRQAWPAARRIAALKERARKKRIPSIYVNDNFGRWQSDRDKVIDRCCAEKVPGARISNLLRPTEEDYFVVKPKHSAFYSTTLDTLLNYLQAKTLILAGFAGNLCVLFTANDAYMRDYHLCVPRDCVASVEAGENRAAILQMKKYLKADTTVSAKLKLERLRK